MTGDNSPENTARPAWFPEGDTIRVADAFVVDLMFTASGEDYESLLPHAVTIDFDGVPLRTVTLEGLLKTKQTTREKDRMDRTILERALAASKQAR
ncbi:MAG: hypothetical protein IPF55_08235 [Rhodoferax sp.]|nr:hypothetical protein [Rhodoferax sp.]